ncbi:MAG TPA: phosphopentomutase [Herpetosiphon sp.]|uniref:Phosphopentomutase n=1 Tax=Herpetosiphon aurantiacus (strain ATCC 23779 / DSM 785 / 114-95) TaxID=316274 RepID=DEOB_HERA2|nr:phosphopentomutase [Herpetosiphon sp.]A9B2N4.1 RecName: Full=Phosphopentomutase; AltName: Full=Phosphodeoxyribomutase [Herpetosiphon aurantiacus DSM 785]ABX05485.1 phosphopentomutase [Herpetosiphon aurantiacus DSM 785]HBW52867.1 phosphopentomutase [Herpetosiphon sp.]
MDIKRVTVIVLDGVGIGEAPDADEYGDVGSHSLANTAAAINGLDLPNMAALGLGCISEMQGVACPESFSGSYGKMQPLSKGKDTVSGHWEMMGIVLPTPFPVYPDGFPAAVIEPFKQKIGRGVLGNKSASGTDILEELGMEHIRTGDPIVYTSADSVFQIAAHEDVITPKELYAMCEIAREILVGEHAVGRVIARPFIGDSPETFKRTIRRHDYALTPETPTILDKVVAAGKQVYSVGKIDDIFGNRGISVSNHTVDNAASLEAVLEFLDVDFEGLLFANFIEFDMIYGHRNDPVGYANALKAVDQRLPELQAKLRAGDLVVITADHGVDPTTPGSNHSREYVPLLVFGPEVRSGVNLGTRQTLSDLAATIAEIFGLEQPLHGTSFLSELQ